MYEMGDPVPVVPRFSDQPAAQPFAPPAAPIAAPVAGGQTDAGLFTSFYENRTIVFLIVIVVLLLGFAALWMSKSSAEDNPPKNVQGAPAPATTSQAPATATPQAAPAAQTTPQAPQQTKDELENLLTQARAPTPTAPAPAPVVQANNNAPIYSSKSDAELMHLMEDAPARAATTDVIQCSAIIPPNRQCKNPAIANGKCAQHDKA